MIKKKIAAGVAGIAILAGLVFAGISMWERGTEAQETRKENQSYVYAYVTNIAGNELTYMELDEAVPSGRTGEDGGEKPQMPSGRTEEGGGRMPQNSESITTYIPVDTVVHTNTDTVTTFQRLASGDRLKLLVETDANGEEVIVEIWIL